MFVANFIDHALINYTIVQLSQERVLGLLTCIYFMRLSFCISGAKNRVGAQIQPVLFVIK
jgi:hypothetical protein